MIRYCYKAHGSEDIQLHLKKMVARNRTLTILLIIKVLCISRYPTPLNIS